MGISPDAFDMMTPAQFVHAWMGWSSQQRQLLQQAWERERWSVWILTTIQLERKDRRPMTEMFPLPWETEALVLSMTMEQRKARIQQILNPNSQPNTHDENKQIPATDDHSPATHDE